MDIIDENNFGKAATKYLLGGGTTTKYDPSTGRAYTAPVNGKIRDSIGITADNPVGSALAAYGYLQNAKAGADRARWEREQEKARREAEAEQRKLAQEQQRYAKLVSTNEGAEEMVEEEEKKFSEKAEKLKKIAKEAVKDTAISAGKAHYMETHWKDATASTNEDTTSFGQRVSTFKQSAPGQAKDFAKGVGDYVVGAAISAGANLAANRAGYYGAKAKYALDDRMQSWRNATLEKARAKAEREKLQLAEKQYREQQRLEQKQAKEAQKAGTSL